MWTAGDMSLTVYLNIVAGGLLTGLVYGLAGLGLSLIHAVTRTVNLAHGVLMALALALAGTAQLAARHGGESGFALPAVAAALFLGGFLLHRLVIGRATAAPESVRTLLMLGLALVLGAGLAALPAPTTLAQPAADTLAFGPLLLDRETLHAALVAFLLTALVALFFNLARSGKAMRACADNPLGAQAIGLNLPRLRAAAFGLGTALAGIAGCLVPRSGGGGAGAAADFLLLGLAVVLVGGLASVEGALAGGLAVGVAAALGKTVLAPPLDILAGVAVLLPVLLLRPRGLSGTGA